MSQELEARIAKLEDVEEIKKLQAKYAYFIDTSQMEKVSELFADDFVAEYHQIGTFTTGAGLLEFLNSAGATSSMMRHMMLMPLIEVDGDKARGTWYLHCTRTDITPHGEVAIWIQGKYENDYVRVDGKWKLSHLRFKFDFVTPYDDGWVKTPMMQLELERQ